MERKKWFTCCICKRARPGFKLDYYHHTKCVCIYCGKLERKVVPAIYNHNQGLLYLLQVLKVFKETEMKKFEGTKGQWTVEPGWADNHVSISSPTHGAIAQVVFGMEDPVNDFNAEAYALKQNELAANVRAFACTAEMAQLIIEMATSPDTLDLYSKRVSDIYVRLTNLDFTKAIK